MKAKSVTAPPFLGGELNLSIVHCSYAVLNIIQSSV